MPAGDHLSALDGAFLDLDTADAPLHVGWTMRAEGRPPSVAALRRHLAARLDRVPRFRCRVVAPPAGGRRWEDDPGFDIARHVHAVALPNPGGQAELRQLAGTLLSTPLDPGRPLWRMYLVTGVGGTHPGDGFALVGQAHHALVDGIAALEVAALLFDVEPDAPRDRPAAPWRPARSGRAALAAQRVRKAGSLANVAARAGAGALEVAATPSPSAALASLRSAGDALGALAQPPVTTTLDRTAGARRVVAFAEVGLDALREAGRRREATVNDVLLTSASVALGRALRRRGDRPQRLKAMVPVNTRTGTDGALGNRISFMFIDLPVAEPDAGRALALVRAQTQAAKEAGHAAPLDAVARGAELLPAAARTMATRMLARVGAFNVVVSNVAGPQVPLYLLGRRITALFPAVPVLDGSALTIGAISYDGRVGVGLYADAEVVPDAVDIARDLEAAVDGLRVAQPPDAETRAAPETPWRRRARTLRAAGAQGPGASR